MLVACWWVHFYSPKLSHVFWRGHSNTLWCSRGQWGDTDRLIKPQTEKQIWEVKLKEDPLQHLERVKFVQFYSKAHAVCVFMCVCVSALLQSAATTCTQQTAKWPTGDGRVMWIPALCLYYSPLRSLAGLRVLIACGLPPTSYVFFFFFAGAPSRSYGNQHQHSDQTATAAFPSVCVFFFFFFGWKEVCVICAYDFITVFSSYVAQS